MKITVINGTEKHGVTYKFKEIFLEGFRDKAEITEFYLPKDCPAFCAGCTVCFLKDEKKCKFYIVRAMQKGLGKEDPEYTDFKYWKSNGWLDGVRPWK